MSAALDTVSTAPHRAFRIVNEAGSGNFVVICDHASNIVPPELGNLGLEPEELARHIAWDIGAAEVATRLTGRFDAPAVLCGTSRLVIDCNRHPDDDRACPETSDGTNVPGNHALSGAARADRARRYFTPYHDAIERLIEGRLACGRRPVVLSIHSMTPVMNGCARPWQIAISSDQDRRLADPMLMALRRVSGVTVGDNEPYNLDPAEDYSVPVHATRRGLLHLQVEFRQDEVATADGASRWARIFADALESALAAIAV